MSLTCPNISFAGNKVYQFMHQPLVPHWQAVKRILQYLKGTISRGLLLRRVSLFTCKHFLMPTGWGVVTTVGLQVDFVSFLVIIYCHGVLGNNPLLLIRAQDLSIDC